MSRKEKTQSSRNRYKIWHLGPDARCKYSGKSRKFRFFLKSLSVEGKRGGNSERLMQNRSNNSWPMVFTSWWLTLGIFNLTAKPHELVPDRRRGPANQLGKSYASEITLLGLNTLQKLKQVKRLDAAAAKLKQPRHTQPIMKDCTTEEPPASNRHIQLGVPLLQANMKLAQLVSVLMCKMQPERARTFNKNLATLQPEIAVRFQSGSLPTPP